MRLSSATACPVSLQTEEYVSQWDWPFLNCDHITNSLGHTDFSAIQSNATGEISRFQNDFLTYDGKSTLPQLSDHAWNGTRNNDISLNNTLNLVTGDLPSDGPLDL
jgi:hypothetical protein